MEWTTIDFTKIYAQRSEFADKFNSMEFGSMGVALRTSESGDLQIACSAEKVEGCEWITPFEIEMNIKMHSNKHIKNDVRNAGRLAFELAMRR